MFLHLKLLGVAGMSGLALAQSSTIIPDPCRGASFYYSSAPYRETSDLRNFENSVFRIEAARKTGTGFLIDIKQGLVLTALHVITGTDGKVVPGIIASTPALATSLQLSVVTSSGDVALLRAADPSSLINSGVQPIDVALDFLQSNKYFTMGYPGGRKQLLVQTADGLYQTDNGLSYEVNQHTAEQGASGSPLIDEQGAAVAVLTDEGDRSDRGLYTRLVDVQQLFASLEPDANALSLDTIFHNAKRATADRQWELVQKLQWKAGNPSNVELIEWADRISGNPAAYKNDQRLLDCPVLRAIENRRISEAGPALSIARMSSPEARGDFYASLANQDFTRGRYTSALQRSQEAASLFAANHYDVKTGQALTVSGLSHLSLHDFGKAQNDLAEASRYPADPPQKARLQIYSCQAYAGEGKSADAIRCATQTLPTLAQFGDVDGQVIAHSTLGSIDRSLGDVNSAISQFTASRELLKGSGNVAALAEVQRNLDALRPSTSARLEDALHEESLFSWNFLVLGSVVLVGIFLFDKFKRKKP